MAVRQYIGARYVPLYDGNWNSTKNYEPLTIVDDANGNSYTSMKDVPAGTPLTDREYWIQTSSFSGAITQLQNRVSDVENDIDETNNRIDELEEQKNLLFLGDSYDANLNYSTQMATYLGYDSNHFVRLSHGGLGFIGPTSGGGTWIDYLRENIGSIQQDKTKFDLIVISGGLNDCSIVNTIDQISAKIEELVTYCKEQFPNAKIKIAMIGVNFDMATDNGQMRYASLYSRVLPAYKQCCLYGAEYLDGTEWILYNRCRLNGNFLDHPIANASNQIWIATHLAKAIKSGSVDVVEGCEITFSANPEKIETPVTGYGGRLERFNDRFFIHDRENFAGVLQLFTLNEITYTAGAALLLDDCLLSNTDLTVLPPITHNIAANNVTFASSAAILKNNTSTVQTTTGAFYKISTNRANQLALYVFAYPNGLFAGTYKAGIRTALPITFEFWHH